MILFFSYKISFVLGMAYKNFEWDSEGKSLNEAKKDKLIRGGGLDVLS